MDVNVKRENAVRDSRINVCLWLSEINCEMYENAQLIVYMQYTHVLPPFLLEKYFHCKSFDVSFLSFRVFVSSSRNFIR